MDHDYNIFAGRLADWPTLADYTEGKAAMFAEAVATGATASLGRFSIDCRGTMPEKNIFPCGKRRKESLDRKRQSTRGWNKYLDLCVTQCRVLRFFLPLLAEVKRGPGRFLISLRENRVVGNFKNLYCESEAT